MSILSRHFQGHQRCWISHCWILGNLTVIVIVKMIDFIGSMCVLSTCYLSVYIDFCCLWLFLFSTYIAGSSNDDITHPPSWPFLPIQYDLRLQSHTLHACQLTGLSINIISSAPANIPHRILGPKTCCATLLMAAD